MTRPFQDAVEKLAIDAIGDPVESEFGYHVIWRTK
jgi:parvulin-like peptidyl-prolyl isomerase